MMPHRTRPILFALCLSFLVGACSSGPPKGGPGGEGEQMSALDGAYVARPVALLIVSYDRDADGAVTGEELLAGAKAEWARMDATQDGAVSAIDLTRWAETYLGSATARPGRLAFDQNGNGSIEALEVERHLLTEFAALDKNEDGMLVRSELVRKLSMPSRGRENGGGGQRRPQGDRPQRR